jgi:DNA mismatch repair ATPase MutS
VYSFEELINDAGLVFDYKIKEGVLKNKNGINVLLRLGYPQTIIDAAFKAGKQLRDKYNL